MYYWSTLTYKRKGSEKKIKFILNNCLFIKGYVCQFKKMVISYIHSAKNPKRILYIKNRARQRGPNQSAPLKWTKPARPIFEFSNLIYGQKSTRFFILYTLNMYCL